VASASLAPINDRPALELGPIRRGDGPTVVVADLHLGLGSTDDRASVPPEALARSMALDLLALARERRADGVLVVGDVKHPIVGTPRALRPVVFDFFSTFLSEELAVEVVLGNHDVGLSRWLPREVVVHSARGLVRGGVGFFHGHRWPSDAVLGSGRLVVGHLHPGFRFAPTTETPEVKQRCWVRTELPGVPARRTPTRRDHAPVAARELIVLPAFNPIAGAESLNREKLRRGRSFLVNRFLGPGRSRAYLLDGTDVGEIFTSRTPRPPSAESAAPPGR
jgi:metallophosphoesterase superfamily enzyme